MQDIKSVTWSNDAFQWKGYTNGTTSYFANCLNFSYTGQQWLPNLGLYYKARMYSLRLGRFLQPDSLVYAESLNLYA